MIEFKLVKRSSDEDRRKDNEDCVYSVISPVLVGNIIQSTALACAKQGLSDQA